MAEGRHRGQNRDPRTVTGSQREMITGWIMALGLSAEGRERLFARITGQPSASVDDLSEKQAGDVLEAMYDRSRGR